MKIFWLFLAIPTILCAMDDVKDDDFFPVVEDVQDPLCGETMQIMQRMSELANQSTAEFITIALAQQRRIKKLNKLLQKLEDTNAELQKHVDENTITKNAITIRRLAIATCTSSVIAAALLAREFWARNPDIFERASKLWQK